MTSGVPGSFVNLNIPFLSDGQLISSEVQAVHILQTAKLYIGKGYKGAAITYSANYGQTRAIVHTYQSGEWRTGIDGANQASVMHAMEDLQNVVAYACLQGLVHIAAITTMNGGSPPTDPWNDDVWLKIIDTDLDRIRLYMDSGWVVFGWQNQNTVDDPASPYAIGGGVVSLPPAVSDHIQEGLMAFKNSS